jgi:hypothetical protein
MMTLKKSWGFRLLAATLCIALALCFVPVPLNAHAAEGGITVDTTSFTTVSTATDNVKVTYTRTPGNVLGSPLYVDRLNDASVWIQDSLVTTSSSQTGEARLLFGATKAGTYTLRLRMGNILTPDATSQNISVVVEKAQTLYDIGAKSHVGILKTGFLLGVNRPWFEVEKKISVTWPIESGIGSVDLQRNDGGKWSKVSSLSAYIGSTTGPVEEMSFVIRQTTAKTTTYRIYCAPTDYTTGGASETFTVSGKARTPGASLTAKGRQVSFKTTGATEGKVTFYDGSKKLKTVTLKHGVSSYTLPAKLKGTRTIKATFKPTGVYAGCYKSVSKSKKIRL